MEGYGGLRVKVRRRAKGAESRKQFESKETLSYLKPSLALSYLKPSLALSCLKPSLALSPFNCLHCLHHLPPKFPFFDASFSLPVPIILVKLNINATFGSPVADRMSL